MDDNTQKILKTFDNWQETIEQLALQCHALPPITLDATKFDENIATQAKCWLQTKAVSRTLQHVCLSVCFSTCIYQTSVCCSVVRRRRAIHHILPVLWMTSSCTCQRPCCVMLVASCPRRRRAPRLDESFVRGVRAVLELYAKCVLCFRHAGEKFLHD